jgi:hypothetical protein
MDEDVKSVLGKTAVCMKAEWIVYSLRNEESIETTVA